MLIGRCIDLRLYGSYFQGFSRDPTTHGRSCNPSNTPTDELILTHDINSAISHSGTVDEPTSRACGVHAKGSRIGVLCRELPRYPVNISAIAPLLHADPVFVPSCYISRV